MMVDMIRTFHAQFSTARLVRFNVHLLPSNTPIQGLVIPGNARVTRTAARLQASGFDVRAIRSPTVPKGTERLRICLHAHNTEEDIVGLFQALQSCLAAEFDEAAIDEAKL
jgi:7-keto-8-aminopelargonate synthetase-like enzyme